jgi:hypothetical protein
MNLMVKAFHMVYDLPIIPPWNAKMDFSHITKARLAMRFGLVVEEFMELCEAMDIRAEINFYHLDENGVYVQAKSQTEKAAEIGSPEHADKIRFFYDPRQGQGFSYLDHDKVEDELLHQIVRERCAAAIEETDERSLPDIVDACFDLKYVIIGFEYEIGGDPQFCSQEGQASNMSKLMPDGSVKRREDGKVLKGPNFFRPDMAKALRAWGMRDV